MATNTTFSEEQKADWERAKAELSDHACKCGVCAANLFLKIRAARKIEEYPSIDEQIAQLKAAGWIQINRKCWKAPVGGYFLGPHGAWCAMKRRATALDR